MTEIYWLQVIGNLGCLTTWFLVLAIIAAILFTIAYFVFDPYDEDDEEKYKHIKVCLRGSLITVAFMSIFAVFIPSEKQLYAIYGLGGTIDYIKSNDKAKQLTDKVVDALTRYVDSIESDKKEDKK